ncbi:class I SAM-dependent methyltransferase [Micromonospora zamorensis]|uniref:class I SAM-dependent methyltransferase n=1 Tax=Micromonospora zamorensis TaxID=709883 RepID=UPI00082002E5|nr:class I SAM-dependent methyltransferase [Micromonospora zamorensis]SCG71174.1 Methyltransferase domain-containing protein [Micromonospora zamorensis]
MTEQHEFDKGYWDRHWHQVNHDHPDAVGAAPPHPYLARETAGLTPGTVLDAGCGTGTEAIWLASHGWQVTAVDIASAALALAAGRAADAGVPERVRWVEADLTTWEPGTQFDLVTTHYAHPAMPHLAFYDRIAGWVAPGGSLLIVGHLHTSEATGHGHHPPEEASVTLADITAGLDSATWEMVTAEEHRRSMPGREVPLHDVVVRATRRR